MSLVESYPGTHTHQASAPRLKLIASSHDGCIQALLIANRVTTETLLELVNAGYATARVDQLARPKIEVTRLRITDAGQKAIA